MNAAVGPRDRIRTRRSSQPAALEGPANVPSSEQPCRRSLGDNDASLGIHGGRLERGETAICRRNDTMVCRVVVSSEFPNPTQRSAAESAVHRLTSSTGRRGQRDHPKRSGDLLFSLRGPFRAAETVDVTAKKCRVLCVAIRLVRRSLAAVPRACVWELLQKRAPFSRIAPYPRHLGMGWRKRKG